MGATFQWLGQAGLSHEDKLAQARAWDRELGPGWLVVNKIKPSTVREVVRITVRDPSSRAFIVQRDLEQRPLAVEETRGFWTAWAVDQVLLWRRPGEVRTECPPGAVRWTNSDTGRDECFSCAPPLVMRVGADGRPYCRRTPALTEAPARPRAPVFRYQSPRALNVLRGAPFEWLGAVVPIKQGSLYRGRWLIALSPPQIASCYDAESVLLSLIAQASAQPTWPWTQFTVVDPAAAPQLTPPWPVNRLVPSWRYPGACLFLVEGVWKDPDGSVDTANFAPLPGTRLLDLWSHGPASNPSATPQVLVDVPSLPQCLPGQHVEMDFLTGEFRCVGAPSACGPTEFRRIISDTGVADCVSGYAPRSCPAGYEPRVDQAARVVVCDREQAPPVTCAPGTEYDAASNTCVVAPGTPSTSASPSRGSGAGIVVALVVLGVAVAIFAATVRGTRVGLTL